MRGVSAVPRNYAATKPAGVAPSSAKGSVSKGKVLDSLSVDAPHAAPDTAALVIDQVVKTYGKDLTVRALRGVSLTVGEHEVVALLGRSGSGKSTLLRCINRLVEPEAGRIVFRDLDKIGRASCRARVCQSV